MELERGNSDLGTCHFAMLPVRRALVTPIYSSGEGLLRNDMEGVSYEMRRHGRQGALRARRPFTARQQDNIKPAFRPRLG